MDLKYSFCDSISTHCVLSQLARIHRLYISLLNATLYTNLNEKKKRFNIMELKSNGLDTHNSAVGYMPSLLLVYPDQHSYLIVYLISCRSIRPAVWYNQHKYTVKMQIGHKQSILYN